MIIEAFENSNFKVNDNYEEDDEDEDEEEYLNSFYYTWL